MINVTLMALAAGTNVFMWLDSGAPISGAAAVFCILLALGWVAVAGGEAARR